MNSRPKFNLSGRRRRSLQTNFHPQRCVLWRKVLMDTHRKWCIFLSGARAASKGRACSHAKFASGKFCLDDTHTPLALGPDQNWFASADEFRRGEKQLDDDVRDSGAEQGPKVHTRRYIHTHILYETTTPMGMRHTHLYSGGVAFWVFVDYATHASHLLIRQWN